MYSSPEKNVLYKNIYHRIIYSSEEVVSWMECLDNQWWVPLMECSAAPKYDTILSNNINVKGMCNN